MKRPCMKALLLCSSLSLGFSLAQGATSPARRHSKRCEPIPLRTEVNAAGFTMNPAAHYETPVVRYDILRDGTVARVTLLRGTGVKGFDRQLIQSVAGWEYKPRPAGCGVVSSEMEVELSFASDGTSIGL